MPFAARLGVTSSVYLWSFGAVSLKSSSLWFFESVSLSHLLLSGLLALSAFWHWAYWDLDLFVQASSGRIVLYLVKFWFGIHLLLASIISFWFWQFTFIRHIWPWHVDVRLLWFIGVSTICQTCLFSPVFISVLIWSNPCKPHCNRCIWFSSVSLADIF